MNPATAPATNPNRPAANPWAFKIGRVSGIPIYLHFTFVLFLLFIGLGGREMLPNLLFVLSLFACVALHELGHALVALRYDVPVADITLYPIGGIARIERQPEPRQELWIALAGPAVNVVIAGALALILAATGWLEPLNLALDVRGNWAQNVMEANIQLALFNLIPAFPMDGGRILRSLLSMKMPVERATAIAATVGQTLAILAGLAALTVLRGAWTLLIIAFFIYIGAGQELLITRRDKLVRNVLVREAMLSEVHTLSQGATYREAADLLLATSQQDFPVVLGDEVYGLLSRDALLRGLASEGPDSYIASGMAREFLRVHPDDDLREMLQQMQEASRPALVFDGDTLVGMVTQENLMEFMVIRQITSGQMEDAVA
jgi:Zn-dependent protease/predicted transcriptional regulator